MIEAVFDSPQRAKENPVLCRLDSFRMVAVIVLIATLSGCNSKNPRLIFMQADQVGANGAIGPNSQGGTLNLGYKGLNVARVPVTVTDADGRSQLIKGRYRGEDSKPYSDSHSVFGRFEANAGGNQRVVLGKLFSTGFAARQLANGYQDALPLEVNKNFVKPTSGGEGGIRFITRTETVEVKVHPTVKKIQMFLSERFKKGLITQNPCSETNKCDGVMGNETRQSMIEWASAGFKKLDASEQALWKLDKNETIKSKYSNKKNDNRFILLFREQFAN